MSDLGWILRSSPRAEPKRVFLRILVVRSQAEAVALWERLTVGEPFDVLARRHSIDATASRGGYLGEVWLEKMSSEFRDVAKALRPGGFSTVFRSGFEFVLLYRLPRDFRTRASRLEEEGDRLLKAGQVQEAIQTYQQAITLYPDLAHAHFSLGVAYGVAGDSAREQESYMTALRLNPEVHEAHYNLGRLLMAQNNPHGAIREFQQALHIKPDHAESYVNLSALYLARGDTASAAEAARRAIEINPLLSAAYYNLGNAQTAVDLEAALESFETAAILDPTRTEARLNAALALARLGRKEQAVNRLQQLLLENANHEAARQALSELTAPTTPSDPAATHAEQGRKALREGKIEEAVAEFERAVRLKPYAREFQEQRAAAMVALGRKQQAQGRWDAAIATWQKALFGYPESLAAFEALAEATMIKGDFAAAQQYLDQASRTDPSSPILIILRSRLAYEKRDVDAAFGELRKLDLNRLDNTTSLKLLEQLLSLDLDDQAMQLLQRLNLEPRQQLEAAEILIKFTRFAEAERILQSNSLAAAKPVLARLYSSQLRFEEARSLLDRLITAEPANPQLRYLLGIVFLNSGEAERAIQELEEASRLQPDNVNFCYQLGLACAQAGKTSQAIDHLRRGIQLEPDSYLLNYELGRLFLEAGELEAARNSLLKVLAAEPDHMRSYYLLGTLYQHLGELETAEKHFRRFDEIKRALEEGRQAFKQKKDDLKNKPIVP